VSDFLISRDHLRRPGLSAVRVKRAMRLLQGRGMGARLLRSGTRREYGHARRRYQHLRRKDINLETKTLTLRGKALWPHP